MEELYARKWHGSRSAYLGMVAVMGLRDDFEGVVDVRCVNSQHR